VRVGGLLVPAAVGEAEASETKKIKAGGRLGNGSDVKFSVVEADPASGPCGSGGVQGDVVVVIASEDRGSADIGDGERGGFPVSVEGRYRDLLIQLGDAIHGNGNVPGGGPGIRIVERVSEAKSDSKLVRGSRGSRHVEMVAKIRVSCSPGTLHRLFVGGNDANASVGIANGGDVVSGKIVIIVDVPDSVRICASDISRGSRESGVSTELSDIFDVFAATAGAGGSEVVLLGVVCFTGVPDDGSAAVCDTEGQKTKGKVFDFHGGVVVAVQKKQVHFYWLVRHFSES
jgi:hypothetical protein